MKIIKRIIVIVLFLVGILLLVFFDYADRNAIFSKYIPEEELDEFVIYKSIEAQQKAYEKHFQDTLYKFPRHDVKNVKIYRNIPFISRITSKQVDKIEFLTFFNNPDNFNWNETTWSTNETNYIVKFFDYDNKVVGTIWICFDQCGMTDSFPFAPTMKFGGLSKAGMERLTDILNRIYKLEN